MGTPFGRGPRNFSGAEMIDPITAVDILFGPQVNIYIYIYQVGGGLFVCQEGVSPVVARLLGMEVTAAG